MKIMWHIPLPGPFSLVGGARQETEPERSDDDQGLFLTLLNWVMLAVMGAIWLAVMVVFAAVALAWIVGYGIFLVGRKWFQRL